MTDDGVWVEGLLCFYEVFKFLEGSLDRLSHTLIGELDVPGMRRTKAFEEDLHHYCGKEWLENVYKPKESVTSYLQYLATLEEENPHMLAAFIFHLYMGLFTGGEILRKKRNLAASLRFWSSEKPRREAVSDFSDVPVARMRARMNKAMEHIADQLGDRDKSDLIEESKTVFIMNNKMISSISGADRVIARKVIKLTLVASSLLLVYYARRYFANQ